MNFKKSITLILFTSFLLNLFAQSDEKPSVFRFGLKVAPSLTWLSPDKTKFNNLKVSNGGVKFNFAYGLITEFRFAKNYSFLTGVEVTYLGGRINYDDANKVNYRLNDSTALFLKSRDYRLQYITVPLALKLKTNEIGYFTYFGQIGVDASFKIKGRANDDGTLFSRDTANVFSLQGIAHSESDVDILKQVNLFRIALNVGIGAEWNIAGNTSLLFAVNYNNGFTNLFYNKTKDTNKLTDSGNPVTAQKLEEKAGSNFVALTVGVLF